MKAIAIDNFGSTGLLCLRDLSDPRPQQGEVLVRVRAASVNPVDWKIREGQLRFILYPKFPYVPGILLAKSSQLALRQAASKPAIPLLGTWI
jgi:NADPH:quinone reductase-like Zn-dependent oxidoreductase